MWCMKMIRLSDEVHAALGLARFGGETFDGCVSRLLVGHGSKRTAPSVVGGIPAESGADGTAANDRVAPDVANLEGSPPSVVPSVGVAPLRCETQPTATVAPPAVKPCVQCGRGEHRVRSRKHALTCGLFGTD